MKVLFAIGNAQTSKNVADKYYEMYGEKLDYKDVFYFRALLEEVKKDKSYDRIVISEELEQVKAVTVEEIDQTIFSNIDNITDEIQDTDIAFIGADRRTKSDTLISRLFNIGIYSLLLGNDRNIVSLCEHIHSPKSKKEAKEYLNSNPAISGEASNQTLREDEVDEAEFNNILKHYERLGSDTSKYIESFESIEQQYTKTQLRTIAGGIAYYLPPIVSETIKADPRYSQLFEGLRSKAAKKTEISRPKTDGKKGGIWSFLNNKKSDETKKIHQEAANFQEIEEKNAKIAAQRAEEEAKLIRIQAEKEAKEQAEKLRKEAEERLAKEKAELDKKEAEAKAEAERLAKEQRELIQKAEEERRAKERETRIKAEEEARIKAEQEVNAKLEAEKAELEQRLKNEELNSNNKIDSDFNNIFAGIQVEVNKPRNINATNDIFVDIGDVSNINVSSKEISLNVEDDRLKIEQEAKAKAEAEAKLKAEQEAKAKAEAEAKLKAEQEAKAKAEAEAKLKAEQEAKAKIAEEARIRAEQEILKKQAELEKIAKEQEALRQKAEAERIAREQEEEKIKLETERIIAEKMKEIDNNTYVTANTTGSGDVGNFQVTTYELPSDYRKVIAVVGSNKAGTTFIVNAVANNLCNKKIHTSIIDITKTKGIYYIYSKGDSRKIEIAQNCLKNLSDGVNTPISENKFLSIYTSLPVVSENRKSYRAKTVIDTAKRNSNLVIVDCDFTTPLEYFEQAQEIYIVLDMDIIKLQETKVFLRELKNRNFDWSRLKLIVNKFVNIKGDYTPKKIAREYLLYYSDPQMTYTEELDRIQSYIAVPFSVEDYIKYAEGMIKDKISYKDFSPAFMNAIEEICMMIYPQKQSSSPKKKGLFGN